MYADESQQFQFFKGYFGDAQSESLAQGLCCLRSEEVLRKFQECPQDLWLSAEELIDRFVNGIHRPAPLTINFDADRWVKVAEENPGAAQSFTTNVQNLWQVRHN